jgi:hypothetical protein
MNVIALLLNVVMSSFGRVTDAVEVDDPGSIFRLKLLVLVLSLRETRPAFLAHRVMNADSVINKLAADAPGFGDPDPNPCSGVSATCFWFSAFVFVTATSTYIYIST